MKNIILIFSILCFIHCSKKNSTAVAESEYIYPKYDTVAVDSFSAGAMSMNVAEEIRKSSFAYQDSIKKVREKQEEERLAREEAEKQKAAEEVVKKEEEERKRKAEEEKNRKKAAEKVESTESSK